jgi:pyruvate, water dikinase
MPESAITQLRYIRFFDSICMEDLPLVGGKNASLGEMTQSLKSCGVRVPSGFAITADAYSRLLDQGDLRAQLASVLEGIDKENIDDLSYRAHTAQSLIRGQGLPKDVIEEISKGYQSMELEYGKNVDVAVRSSATAEDLPDASFAGQQESFLNVRGLRNLLEACLNCFASLFTDRAVAYRIDKGFDHLSIRLSIGVQKMVRSDLASSGVIFTLDPESGFRDVVLVTSAWGLGENIVGGKVDPDEFLVFKPTLQKFSAPLVRRKIGAKQQRLIYTSHGTRTTKNVAVAPEMQSVQSISDPEIIELSRWACLIEEHYSKRSSTKIAMDIEWAKDGESGLLYIVQARPETVHSLNKSNQIDQWILLEQKSPIVTGRSIGEKIGSGPVRVIRSVHELNTFQAGEVLVADMTDPDWEPVMKKASAIVTNRGGRTCHAAIVSRELGVPCVVGTSRATEVLKDGQPVTVSCCQGASGHVYEGILPCERKVINLDNVPETRTAIMVNVGNPEHAFAVSALPTRGVGLAREEFIIANEVKVHPMALCRLETLPEPVKSEVMSLVRNYKDPRDFFVEKLSEGVGTIAAAFYPRPVIVRLSDFKTNEYSHLLGGEFFEKQEDNPMIGFRGASRYLHPSYREAFAMECKALLRVRKQMGLTNVKLMVPFCRTPNEGQAVIEAMKEQGLVQHEDGLEIYVMCEIPSNVLLIDEFAQIFDGFSIGSNDLTQLVLGVDRDSDVLSGVFDERNPAVLKAISEAIAGAKRAGRKIGICGQAPSDYPEVVRFLLERGIDSISLNEDAIVKTLLMVSKGEESFSGQ